MSNNTYNIELLKYKKYLLIDLNNKLKNNILLKIKSNSNAYKEIEFLISDIEKEIKIFENKVTSYFENNENSFSNIKIKTELLKEMIDIKNELKIESISEFLELSVKNFKDLFLLDKLTKIKTLEIDKSIQKKLNKTNFYISTIENKNEIIVYKLEDLIIHENQEYLNLENFKKYTITSDTFFFSSFYTLQDIDEFKLLWI